MSLRTFSVNKFNDLLVESKTAKKLEKSVYNFTIKKARSKFIQQSWECSQFKLIYKHKILSLIYNLKYGKLKEYIKNKKYDISEIPYLHPWELWPEKYETYFQKKLKKEIINLRDSIDEENTEGLYTCRKCKSKCTSFFSLQTRSADEPMTNYISCKKCGYNWKD